MNYDILIIGSGPGGYVAAIRASQLGLKTAIVERAELGGICLNWGCIPTKALLKSAQVLNYMKHSTDYGVQINGSAQANIAAMVSRSRGVAQGMSKGIQFLLKKNKVEVISGTGKILAKGNVEITDKEGTIRIVEAKHIILATGARSKNMPNFPQDGKQIIGYREALTPTEIPKSMVVVGSGAIGVEFAFFYNSIGTKVVLVEFQSNIVPLEDEEVSKQLARSFQKAGIEVISSASVEKVEKQEGNCIVTINTAKGQQIRECEIVLSAVGIEPNIENIGLEELGIELERGKIKTDKFYQTNIENIYAIGDIINSPALAHVASAEAVVCVENIAGKNPEPINYKNIPACIYTSPEISSVGLSEKAAIEAGYQIKIGKFPFTASGKASAAGNRDGFVKLIFDTKYNELLGAHLIGDNVTEMIAGLTTARNLEISALEILKSIHPHPTMSEAIMEAAAAALGEAIHL